MLTINGWTILAHPLFLDQIEKLADFVASAKAKNPDGYKGHANTKTLAAIYKIAFEQVPGDPTLARYRQGTTLGPEFTHWFREKFGNGRFRLFFRYDLKSKIIIYAWVNDSSTLRTYGAKTDAYAVFRGMLDDGNPPDGWDKLKSACLDAAARTRLTTAHDKA